MVRRSPAMEKASSPSRLSAHLRQHATTKSRLAGCSSFRANTYLVRFLLPHRCWSGATGSIEVSATDAATLVAMSERELAVAIFAAQIVLLERA